MDNSLLGIKQTTLESRTKRLKLRRPNSKYGVTVRTSTRRLSPITGPWYLPFEKPSSNHRPINESTVAALRATRIRTVIRFRRPI